MSSTGTDVDPTIAAAQAEVERNREQLAQTVDHLQQNLEAKKGPAAIAVGVVLLVGVVSILIDGTAPLWLGIATLAREALISTGTLVVAAMGGRRIDVRSDAIDVTQGAKQVRCPGPGDLPFAIGLGATGSGSIVASGMRLSRIED